MYQDYKNVADMYIVYVREAHAADSSWPVGYATEQNIKQPTDYTQRCNVAEILYKEEKLTMPCLIDDMENTVNQLYKAAPTRVFLVRKDGTLGVAGGPGPWGLKPALKETVEWLAKYRETGQEPAL